MSGVSVFALIYLYRSFVDGEVVRCIVQVG